MSYHAIDEMLEALGVQIILQGILLAVENRITD